MPETVYKYIIGLNPKSEFYYRKIRADEIRGLANLQKYNFIFSDEIQAGKRLLELKASLLKKPEEEKPRFKKVEVEDILNPILL